MQREIFLIVMANVFTDRDGLRMVTHAFVQAQARMIAILVRIVFDIGVVLVITGKRKGCRR